MDDDLNSKPAGSMKRRDMLKVISTLPAAALAPMAPPMARDAAAKSAIVPAQGEAGAEPYKRKILTEHEWKTVSVLSDWIVPADERSGSATQAGVPAFIDDMLDFRGGMMLAEIRGGLTWLDLECNRLYDHDFVDCPKSQQKAILDRIAYPKTAAPEDANAVAFFNRLRGLVLSGFFSSEMGIKDLPYLGNRAVEHWDGCPPEVMAKIRENEEQQKT